MTHPIAVFALLSALGALLDFSRRQIVVKILYHGPGTGPAENLRWIHKLSPPSAEAKMRSSPSGLVVSLSLGDVRGFKTKLHLYSSLEGESLDVWRNRSLRNLDGIVFVADADATRASATNQSLTVLKGGLCERGGEHFVLSAVRDVEQQPAPHPVPVVLQVLGTDKPGASSREHMVKLFNGHERAVFDADPTHGVGVWETLKAITRESLEELTKT